MHFPLKVSLLFSLLLLPLLSHQCQFKNKRHSAFNYVNEWRKNSGLHTLKQNKILEKAALNHSKYRTHYNTGHHERRGDHGFTGRTPSDRALYAGYALKNASENIAEAPNAMVGVVHLMTAIYHRFGFLNYNIDEMGMARAQGKSNYIYTYVMGHSLLAKECQHSSYKNESPFYKNVCKDSRQKIAVAKKSELDAKLVKYAPKFVLYPYDGAKEVFPAFYEEHPDPLPRHTMVGNPLSIEFHPRYLKKKIKINDVRLWSMTDSKPVALMPLYQRNDPHKKLLTTQFAFFPQQRLAWGTDYEARLSYKISEDRFSSDVIWRFKTETMPSTLTVDRNHRKFKVQKNKTYTLYFKPDLKASKSRKSVHPQFGYSYYQGTEMKNHIIDSMTLQVCLHGKRGDVFKVKSGSALGVKEVELVLE